jgi:hypothetical protein
VAKRKSRNRNPAVQTVACHFNEWDVLTDHMQNIYTGQLGYVSVREIPTMFIGSRRWLLPLPQPVLRLTFEAGTSLTRCCCANLFSTVLLLLLWRLLLAGFPEKETAKAWSWTLTPANAKVNNAWRVSPYAFMVWCLHWEITLPLSFIQDMRMATIQIFKVMFVKRT